MPGEGKEGQASGESTGPGLDVVGPDYCLPAWGLCKALELPCSLGPTPLSSVTEGG